MLRKSMRVRRFYKVKFLSLGRPMTTRKKPVLRTDKGSITRGLTIGVVRVSESPISLGVSFTIIQAHSQTTSFFGLISTGNIVPIAGKKDSSFTGISVLEGDSHVVHLIGGSPVLCIQGVRSTRTK